MTVKYRWHKRGERFDLVKYIPIQQPRANVRRFSSDSRFVILTDDFTEYSFRFGAVRGIEY